MYFLFKIFIFKLNNVFNLNNKKYYLFYITNNNKNIFNNKLYKIKKFKIKYFKYYF